MGDNITDGVVVADGGFFQNLKDIERQIIESTGDPEAIAILDREDAESEAEYQAELASDGYADE